MSPPSRPIAFVAMKFSAQHWKDTRYLAIREALESAGFDCIRGDEVQSSGPVVDEVCRLLRDAELVIIDAAGDSHSVSYEIGYCHGSGRDPSKTLLLSTTATLPFNYRHFRSRVYKDTRSLKRMIRDFLGMAEPVRDDQYGYAFSFTYSKSALHGYIMDAVECILDALAEKRLSGRCECYAGENFGFATKHFSVGVAIRDRVARGTPSYEYWSDVMARLPKLVVRFGDRIAIDDTGCELATKSSLRGTLPYHGAAEFKDGTIIRTIDCYEEHSFFDSYLARKQELPPKPSKKKNISGR